MLSRRTMIASGAAALAGGALLQGLQALARRRPSVCRGRRLRTRRRLPPGEPGKDYTPVVTPNGSTLPWKVVDGVKVFHLVAEEFEHEFAPGLKAKCWGYNGRTPGPTIEVVEGDRVRIYVTNRLPEPTTIHWHGILLPNGMDGVAG